MAVLRECHDVRIVQAMLGHSSLETTQIYTAFDQVAAANAVQAIPPPALRCPS